jgi:hypothetical protein
MMALKDVRRAALFEKSAQKLLPIWCGGVPTPQSQINKSFFGSFCSQKELLLPSAST